MSALTNLLPITAAPAPRPSAVSANDKSVYDKSATETARSGAEEQERRSAFADVYEEELEEQSQATPVARPRSSEPETSDSESGAQSDNRSDTHADTHSDTHSEETSLADSGNPLPLAGETLPPVLPDTLTAEEALLRDAAATEARLLASTVVQSLPSETPITGESPLPQKEGPTLVTPTALSPATSSHTTEAAVHFVNSAVTTPLAPAPDLVTSSTATLQSAEQPQALVMSAAAATRIENQTAIAPGNESGNIVDKSAGGSVVPAANSASVTGMATDALMSSTPGVDAGSAVSAAATAVTGVQAHVTGPIEAQSVAVSEPQSPVEAAQPSKSVQSDNAASLASVQQQSEEVLAREQLTAKITETNQASATAVTAEQAQDTLWQSQVADRVRAWRGLAGAESTVNLTTQSGTSASSQSSTAAFAMTGSLGGQLQQFAESLRVAVNNPSPACAVDTSSVSAASTPGNVDSSGAWRGDSAASAIQQSGGRGAAGPTFQQTLNQNMQASSFGQPLGQAFGEKGWAESLSQRVTMMAGQKVSSARIELDPPELGAMVVKITVTGDQASVNFASANSVVRDALEQTFPRLQDLLGQQGLQLADANVSDNSARGRNSGEANGGAGNRGTSDEPEIDQGAMTHTVKAPVGLIDFYA